MQTGSLDPGKLRRNSTNQSFSGNGAIGIPSILGFGMLAASDFRKSLTRPTLMIAAL
jgi:hypothetical protein